MIPKFIYGTAWKEDATEKLTLQAIKVGFRAIDTANQRKHYFEVGVGNALLAAYEANIVKREDIFLQTKFTSLGGQDHRLPYDPKATVTQQVQQSCQSSLEHLHTDYLDSYVLHGPTVRFGLAEADYECWRAMEKLYAENTVRSLGVSNVSAQQLLLFLEHGKVKPNYVQNRCYASTGWDKDVRTICQEFGVKYQGFSLLTANQHLFTNPDVKAIAQQRQKTIAQVIFRYCKTIGIILLTGSSTERHLREDLDMGDFALSEEELLCFIR